MAAKIVAEWTTAESLPFLKGDVEGFLEAGNGFK
jgi:hypothetical protein